MVRERDRRVMQDEATVERWIEELASQIRINANSTHHLKDKAGVILCN